MTRIGSMEVEGPLAYEFEKELKQELELVKSRREKLLTCERFLLSSAVRIGENQLEFEIARDIVERDKLYVETHRSIKQWEESLGLSKLQLECSKDHKDSVIRAIKQFRHRTGFWPWNILIQEYRPTSWSRPILQGLAKLATLCPRAREISYRLQTAIQERGRRTSSQRGLSKAEKLVPADIVSVIKSIEGSSGTLKKRKRDIEKNGTQGKGPPSKKHIKTKWSTERGALEGERNEKDTAGDITDGAAPVEKTDEAHTRLAGGRTPDGGAATNEGSSEKVTSTTRRGTDSSLIVEGMGDGAQLVDRRARVENEQEEDPPQQPPQPQTSLPISPRRMGNSSLHIAKIAFDVSQIQLTEAENQLRHIEAAQREIGRRLAHCEPLTAVPSLDIREIQRELSEVAEIMAKPCAILKVQKEKANGMRAQARTLYEIRSSTAKMWAILSAWAKSQAQCFKAV